MIISTDKIVEILYCYKYNMQAKVQLLMLDSKRTSYQTSMGLPLQSEGQECTLKTFSIATNSLLCTFMQAYNPVDGPTNLYLKSNLRRENYTKFTVPSPSQNDVNYKLHSNWISKEMIAVTEQICPSKRCVSHEVQTCRDITDENRLASLCWNAIRRIINNTCKILSKILYIYKY